MDQTTPLLLVPGLASSARIYGPVVPALWRFGPVMIANHIRDDSMRIASCSAICRMSRWCTISCPSPTT